MIWTEKIVFPTRLEFDPNPIDPKNTYVSWDALIPVLDLQSAVIVFINLACNIREDFTFKKVYVILVKVCS